MIINKVLSNLLIFISKYQLLSNLFSIFMIIIVILNNLKLFNKKKTFKGLALSCSRFRDDINVLNESSQISIYKMPVRFQYLLLIPFEKYLYKYKHKYFYPLEELHDVKKLNQKYLSKILNFFFNYFDFILTASVSYLQDMDLSRAAKSYGLKHIVLQRENFGIVDKQADDMIKWYMSVEETSANLIIVHSESTKLLFQKTKMAAKTNIEALGCLRMDNYIHRLKNKTFKTDAKHKTVTFFSFATNSGCHLAESPKIDAFEKNRGLINFFKNTHNLIINFAKKNSSINIYIKPKWKKNWEELILKNWTDFSGDTELPKNCKILASSNPHDLIMVSDLVIGFNSTTILEAGLRDIPIIIPKFDEANSIYREYFDFTKYKDAFSIVENPNKLNELIHEFLFNFKLSKEVKKKRLDLFNKYVSSLDGQTKDRYIEAIKKTIIKKS